MSPSRLQRFFVWPAIAALATGTAFSGSIRHSPHDLSTSGPGPHRAVNEQEVCVFCHTPHNADIDAPLWNRFDSGHVYTPYQSSTAKATIGQPTGASRLCLSCHDGTVALGMTRSRGGKIQFTAGRSHLARGSSDLGTDLSDDHPISFSYDRQLVAQTGNQLQDPSRLSGDVHLDRNGELQCTSCHNAHDNEFGKFLVKSNRGSALCTTCHLITGWPASDHSSSTARWSGQGNNPFPGSRYATVAENGCSSCHDTHAAAGHERLLSATDEEDVCYTCHQGSVAEHNIMRDFKKASAHPIEQHAGVHDPAEDVINAKRHVECADCHNPHAARSAAATAPDAPGSLSGVKGVNISGAVVTSVTRSFELCFRCHGDSGTTGNPYVRRVNNTTNTRIEFSPGNASFHPVVAIGRNSEAPSILPPLTANSQIYCSDCHASDQSTGNADPVRGPHGSIYPPILERRLTLLDGRPETESMYALCYKCHSRESILNNESFSYHSMHIREEKAACTTCHDPHGVANTTHLINFNTDYVTPSGSGRLEFVDDGNESGRCYLTCHEKDHDPAAYPIPLTGQPISPARIR